MKLIVLDRDGVINFNSDAYIKSPQEWQPIPGSLQAIARLNKAGYRITVATNQSGLARGFYDVTTLNEIHQKMHDLLKQQGGQIEDVVYCPHGSDDGCDCRKPKPGLLQQIAQKLQVDLQGVPMVGDSLRDIQAAISMQMKPMLVRTGNGLRTLESGELPEHVPVYENLASAVNSILETH